MEKKTIPEPVRLVRCCRRLQPTAVLALPRHLVTRKSRERRHLVARESIETPFCCEEKLSKDHPNRLSHYDNIIMGLEQGFRTIWEGCRKNLPTVSSFTKPGPPKCVLYLVWGALGIFLAIGTWDSFENDPFIFIICIISK